MITLPILVAWLLCSGYLFDLVVLASVSSSRPVFTPLSVSFVHKFATDNKQLFELLHTRNGDSLRSQIVQSHNINFQLQIYPNGRTVQQPNQFLIYLCATNLGINNHIVSVLTDWTLDIYELNASWVLKDRYHSDYTRCRGLANYDAHPAMPSQITQLLLYQLQATGERQHELTVGVTVHLKRIIDATSIVHKQIPLQINRVNTIQWILNDSYILNAMKYAQTQQTFLSEVYDDLWFFSLSPNGFHEGLTAPGRLDLYLHSVQLPATEISRIWMRCRLTIPEIKYMRTLNSNWSLKDRGWGSFAPGNVGERLKSLKAKQLTISARCETVGIYGSDRKKLDLKQYWKYFKIAAKRDGTEQFFMQKSRNEQDGLCTAASDRDGVVNDTQMRRVYDALLSISGDIDVVQSQLAISVGVYFVNLLATLAVVSSLAGLICCNNFCASF
eukprot:CAMPEP_0197022314 /NCGR_PEP_ID=MMETSP1384-20130603/3219_1 /TAXON_ID=29189 /ORGANISM="Ammonia sp." /LENGTH=442 /DNA_ID=CAMNT_0042450333 /DNA_START=39 /DNA_END=1367 /DNA_ORIENTATION=+